MWDTNGPHFEITWERSCVLGSAQSQMVISVATVRRLWKSLAKSMRTKGTSHPGGIWFWVSVSSFDRERLITSNNENMAGSQFWRWVLLSATIFELYETGIY